MNKQQLISIIADLPEDAIVTILDTLTKVDSELLLADEPTLVDAILAAVNAGEITLPE